MSADDDLGVGTSDQEARERLQRITALLDAKDQWLRRWTVPLLAVVAALVIVAAATDPWVMVLIGVPITALIIQLRNRKALERARQASLAVVTAVEDRNQR